VNHLKLIFLVALVAAFCANAGAGPFGPDYGRDELCAAAWLTAFHPPVSQKDQP
jgi:hypothetical protein